MNSTSCKIHFTKKVDRTIYASNEVIKQLEISSSGKKIKLRCGRKEVITSLKRIKKKGKHLYIPDSVRQSIRVPKGGNIMLLRSSDDEVQLGPLIGIMTTGGYRTASHPFGSRSDFIKQFLKVGSQKAFYFAFSPRDINWLQETVLAHFIGVNGNWIKKTVPLPDVVYNRLPSRRAEKSLHMINLKERFVRRNIPIFNWSFFDKWDVYHLLQDETEAFKHVPESYIDPSPEQIKEMLETHNFIYLKPTGGSLGKGIYRLTYNKKRGYFARFRRNGRNVLLRFSKFSGLMKLVKQQSGRLKNYVAQQGIRLIELDRCPIDFRFHLNKNAQNNWVVAGIGAKKAGRGSITTHVRTGGKLMTPEQALYRIYGESKANDTIKNMKRTSIKLAEAIERNYPHLIGELGFDIGMDQKGNIWMFEANSKPGRSIFKHPSLKLQGKATLVHIFEHCLYLSKFRSGRRKA
jgi:hypothetical protein